MNYEKAYKEALERARSYYNNEEARVGMTPIDLEEIFPELAESEDERIRKEIIAFLTYYHTGQGNSVKYDDGWIAWLEKLGDKDKLIKELGEYKVKYTQEVLKRHLNSVSNKDDETLRAIAFLKDFADKGYENAVECIDWLEKQGEQKPTSDTRYEVKVGGSLGVNGEPFDYEKATITQKDFAPKVEPKFKVGDFIVNGYCMGRVVELTDDAYLLDSGQGIPFSCEHNAHLWTIEDAKDGDVLVYGDNPEDHHIRIIMLFKSMRTSNTAFNHFQIFGDGFRTNDWCDCGKTAHPATKEQCDLLFQKMREAGYKWNPGKKELKKVGQKPDWSDDDEQYLLVCKNALNKYESTDKWDADIIFNWLNSLKDRVQTTSKYTLPQREEGEPLIYYFEGCIAEISPLLRELFFEVVKEIKAKQWKPSDEQMEIFKDLIEDNNQRSFYPTLKSLYNDLEKLKEK